MTSDEQLQLAIQAKAISGAMGRIRELEATLRDIRRDALIIRQEIANIPACAARAHINDILDVISCELGEEFPAEGEADQ